MSTFEKVKLYMKRSVTLRKNEDFKEIYSTGKSYANKYLIMYVKKNQSDNNRVGISVSKRVGNSVIRHRITRLIRESYRLLEDKFESGLDIIVVARVGARGKQYSEIESALLHLMKLHRIGK